MKRVALTTLTMALVAGSFEMGACARKQKSRDASVLAYVPVAPDFALGAPAALTSAAAPGGPKTCADPGCPTLAESLRPLLGAVSEPSVAALLGRVDGRMAAMTQRAVLPKHAGEAAFVAV